MLRSSFCSGRVTARSPGAIFDRRTVSALILSLDSFVNGNGLEKIRETDGKVQFGSYNVLEVAGRVQEVKDLLQQVWDNVKTVFPEREKELKDLFKAL